jgi:glycosyltransferase involved in cell wall biosynthesis
MAKRYAQREYDVAINYLETESPAFLKKHIKAKKYLQWYHTDVAHLDSPGETDKMISDFAEMDAIICVANSSQKSFVERYPFLSEKTHVLYNFFEKDAVVRMGNEPFSYEEDCFTMLSVGRMTPQKKYLRFLDVLARLKREGYSFSWHILGTGYEQDALSTKIKSLGLERCVFLEGVTDNPYKYMKNCDLFVLPSGWEGFPTVTVEAKILGCPVLATDVSGIREQLLHGETGWIVDNSKEGLYEGLKQLLDHPDLCQTLKSNRGMERILNNDLKFSEFEEICFGKHSKHKP